jgi:uncharacterized protein
MRVLLYAALFAILYLALKRWSGTPRRRARLLTTRMVRCAYCGVHVPEGEAIGEGPRFFCSPEHRRIALPPGV